MINKAQNVWNVFQTIWNGNKEILDVYTPNDRDCIMINKFQNVLNIFRTVLNKNNKILDVYSLKLVVHNLALSD